MKDYLLKDPAKLLGKYQKNVLTEIKTLNKLLTPIILLLLLLLLFSFFNRELVYESNAGSLIRLFKINN